MTAWRYEISFLVLKDISRVSAANEWNIYRHEKRNSVFFVRPVTSSKFNIYFSTFLHYFLQTSSNNVQEIIESKVEKRTKGKPQFLSRPFIMSPLIFTLSHSQLTPIIILVSRQILLFSVLLFQLGQFGRIWILMFNLCLMCRYLHLYLRHKSSLP